MSEIHSNIAPKVCTCEHVHTLGATGGCCLEIRLLKSDVFVLAAEGRVNLLLSWVSLCTRRCGS